MPPSRCLAEPVKSPQLLCLLLCPPLCWLVYILSYRFTTVGVYQYGRVPVLLLSIPCYQCFGENHECLLLWITRRLITRARTRLAVVVNRQDRWCDGDGEKSTRTGISCPEQAINCTANNHQCCPKS